MSLSYKINWKT